MSIKFKKIYFPTIIVILIDLITTSDAQNDQFKFITGTSGQLDGGNYTHYEIRDPGTFKITLISLEGDADLYISDKYRFVDYSNCDLQSTTYGVDELIITKDMKRPVFISVYGHPYYPHTMFKLNQYAVTLDFSNNEYYDVLNLNYFDENLAHGKMDSALNNEYKDRENSDVYNRKSYSDYAKENKDDYYDESKNNYYKDLVQQKGNLYSDIKQDYVESFEHDNESEDSGGGESLTWRIFLHLLQFIAEVFL